MRPRIVVDSAKPKRTPLRMLQGAAIGTLMMLAAWMAWSLTRGANTGDLLQVQAELQKERTAREALARELLAARGRIDELQEARVFAEQSLQIDKQAHADLQSSIARLQAEAADLREQLEFYRGIVSPEQARAGVRIYELRVLPTGIANNFRYELMLIQSVRQEKRVNGRVELNLTVRDAAGRKRVLDLSASGVSRDAENLLFSLQYFQELSGEFRLAPGLTPLRVRVRLLAEKSGAPVVENQYEWQAVLREGGGA